ncbi:HNH endonuclease signature motif containing protein [Microvirga sp. 0TCS3.31]
MPRNYSMITIKTLFAEASCCAYPGCREPLIFRDRGTVTAVADIAHIRSSTPAGPRFDANFPSDTDDPDNLLLLCGKHHRPVDRHEAAYPVSEMLEWKRAQRAEAGTGTELSQADLRNYARLSEEERRALAEIARLAQRVRAACTRVAGGYGAIRDEREQAISARIRQVGEYGENEHGQRVRPPREHWKLTDEQELAFSQAMQRAWNDGWPKLDAASQALIEELAVLRMSASDLSEPIAAVELAADDAVAMLHDRQDPGDAVDRISNAVDLLWRAANGLDAA